MKRLAFSVLIASMSSSLAWAQDPGSTPTPLSATGQKARLGGGLVLGLPIGHWSDVTKFSVGGLADFDYALLPELSLTGRAGFIYHVSNVDGASFFTIPVWSGVKYYLGQGHVRPFAAGELGFNYNHASVEVFGQSVSSSSLNLGTNLGGGVEMGPISIRGFLAFLDLGSASDSFEIMASASYYFTAF